MPLSHCAAVVRENDYDRYLCTLLAPENVREAWCVLFAFNHEIAIISEMVSEPMIGHVRFAWWRDVLDKIYAGTAMRGHPVAEALSQVIQAHALPRAPFDALLAARISDLEQEELHEFAGLESYCRDTSASLLQLCNAVAGLPVSSALDDLGIAWALIGMARAGLHDDTISTEKLIDAAHQHLQVARAERRQSLQLFAPFIDCCDFYLGRLRTGKKNTPHAGGRLRLILALWFRSLR